MFAIAGGAAGWAVDGGVWPATVAAQEAPEDPEQTPEDPEGAPNPEQTPEDPDETPEDPEEAPDPELVPDVDYTTDRERTRPAREPDVVPALSGSIVEAETVEPDHGEEIDPKQVWWLGSSRWFVSGAIDIGALYVRPRFSTGYGRPHAFWAGIDANPVVTFEGVGAYAGARGFTPWIDLRVGARYFFAWRRSLLVPRPSYDHLQIESRVGPASQYISLESELTWKLPLGPGDVTGEIAGTYVLTADDAFFVYEEQLQVVVDPPWVWRARLGYELEVIESPSTKLEVVGELVGVPRRDAYVVRAGIEWSIQLWPDLELRGRILPPVYSTDSLGIGGGGNPFEIGIRYLFSTR